MTNAIAEAIAKMKKKLTHISMRNTVSFGVELALLTSWLTRENYSLWSLSNSMCWRKIDSSSCVGIKRVFSEMEVMFFMLEIINCIFFFISTGFILISNE